MAYDMNFPADDSYLSDFPAGDREQNRALKDDQIVNAGQLQGLTAGNKNGQIPINNGTENTNLNAALLNGKASSYFATSNHIHDVATQSSNGYMSNADKKKLDGIASGAEVNQNAFANVKVGSTTIQSDAKQDTLELAAGTNISLVGDANNDKVTIAVTGKVASASQADNATNATRATQDKNGLQIDTNYLKRSGGTITGQITMGTGTEVQIKAPNNTGFYFNSGALGCYDWSGTNGGSIFAYSPSSNTFTFGKNVTAPTPGTSDNSTRVATTAFVKNNFVEILKKVYPVGAIYISTVSTSPSTLFGFGTWEQIQGRFLLGASSSHEVGTTGGAETVTLTSEQLPSHSHDVTVQLSGEHNHIASTTASGLHSHKLPTASSLGSGSGFLIGVANSGSLNIVENGSHTHTTNISYTGSHTHTTTVSKSGSGQAHTNMPPYLTVYMWKRTA